MSESLRAVAALDGVAASVAASFVNGAYEERKRAWALAGDVERQVPGFAARVQEEARHLDPWSAWEAPKPAEDKARGQLRQALAEHIAGAYVSGSDDQVRQARLLETALDGIGLNVDTLVDRLVLEQARALPSVRGTGGLLPNLPPF